MVRKKPSSSSSSDLSDDPDTEEALKGFDFLAGQDELDGSPETKSGEDSGEWGEAKHDGKGVSDWHQSRTQTRSFSLVSFRRSLNVGFSFLY